MTKFRRKLGVFAAHAAILGALAMAYILLFANKTTPENKTIVAVILAVFWIVPMVMAALWLLTEKLTIDDEKVVVKTLFGKKEIAKQNLKKIRVLHGDIALRQADKVCLVPIEVSDEIAEGRGDENYILLTKKDKRIIRFPMDGDNKLLLKKHGWKI